MLNEMETADSDEPQPEETRRDEDPPDLNQIVSDYLQQILNKLECSFEEFPALLSSKLEECLSEAERSSMERIRPSLDRLSVLDPASLLSIREVFINAKSVAEKTIAGKIKSLESTFLQIFHQSMDDCSENLAKEIRAKNETRVQEILHQYGSRLEEAKDAYRIFLKTYADCKDYWPEERLEKIHLAAAEYSEKLLLAKLVGSDLATGARVFLLKQLNSSLELEFEIFKNLNEQALESSQLKFEEMASTILRNFQAGIPDILSVNVADPRAAIQNFHSEAVTKLLQAYSVHEGRSVDSQYAMLDTLNELDSCRDEALQNIQKLDVERAKFNAALESAKTEASQLFKIEISNYSSEFSILDRSEYESKSKELELKILSNLRVNTELDSGSIEKIKSFVKEALNLTRGEFWAETISPRNTTREARIRNEMSSVKIEFKEHVAEFLENRFATFNPNTFLNRTVSRFSAGFLSGISNEFQEELRSELEKDLCKILEDMKLEVSLKAGQEAQELIREFRRLASTRKDTDEFYKEQQEKLSKIAITELQQEKFQYELELVLEDAERVSALVEDLINNFRVVLATESSAESLDDFKSQFVETLRAEALKLAIDPTEHCQRLTDSMEALLQDSRKRMEQRVAEKVEKTLRFYKDEIGSHFKPPRVFSPQRLLALHRKIKEKTLQRFPNETSSTIAPSSLILGMTEAFQEFVSVNYMNMQKSASIGISSRYNCSGVYQYEEHIFVATHQGYWDPNLRMCIFENADYYTDANRFKFFSSLKQNAEDSLEQNVTTAVLALPSYISKEETSLRKASAKAAGLKVLEIISEPEAAVIAYNLHWKKVTGPLTGLVYHLGQKWFNFALFSAQQGTVKIVSEKHANFQTALVDAMVKHCVEEFRVSTGIDLMADKDAPETKKDAEEFCRQLANRCDSLLLKMKRSLAWLPPLFDSSVHVNHGVYDLKVKITGKLFRETFLAHIEDSFQVVEKELQRHEMSVTDLSEVVGTGYCIKIPVVQERLRDFFQKEVHHRINPTKVFAVGAAYKAAVLNGKRADERKRQNPAPGGTSKRFKPRV